MRQYTIIGTLSRVAARSLALALASALIACGQVSSSADQHIDRAQQAHATGDVAAARIEIRNALQKEPARAEARLLLGLYNLEIGDAAAAEAELVRAQDLGEDSARIRLPLARARLMQGKLGSVIEETQPLANFTEDQIPEALTLRGHALLAQGETSAARSALQEALALDPLGAEALLGLAWIDWLAGDAEAARAHLDAALSHDPRYALAWELLGDLERGAGNTAKAEAAYTRAVESAVAPFSPQIKRALTRVMLEDYTGAQQDVHALHRRYGQQPAVSFARGFLAFQQQRFDDARTDFQESLARDANYMPAVFFLGATQYALQSWQQAEHLLVRYLNNFPDSAEASRLLALTRLQEGDTDRAERALQALLERAPEDRGALTMVSDLYLAQGRSDEALRYLRRTAALHPDSPATRGQIGLALMQQGQRDEGLAELTRAIELAPEGEAVRLELAIILERLRAQEFQQALDRVERLRDREDLQTSLYFNLKGISHLGLGDTVAAEAAFREGLAAAPEATYDLANNLAGLLAQTGRFEEARAIAIEGLEKHPEHLGLLTTMAAFSTAAGDSEGARTFLQRAVDAHPEVLQPRLQLAEILLQDNRPGPALAVLRGGEPHHGDSVEWLRLATMAYLGSGDRRGAVEVLQRLRAQDPEAADVHLMLGRILVDLGEREEARVALERGLELRPDHLEARLLVVELLTREQQFERAANVLAPARTSHPAHPQVLGQAGALAFAQGRIEESVQFFQEASESSPGDRNLVGGLVQALVAAEERGAAASTLARWLENRPEDQDMRLLHASVLQSLDRQDDAVQAYRRFLEGNPDHVVALNNLAWLLKDVDTAEALRMARRAVELAPESGLVLDTRGAVELAAGDYGTAISTLKRATELAPELPEIRVNLVKAMIADGRDREARQELDILIRDFPDSKEREEAQRLLRRP